ncbi:hypothetical protein QUF76_14510 [Desulfobacterales bacterium HSG16]|nr:hypothetical protein [Desulfobacterales bacterium HSG16]
MVVSAHPELMFYTELKPISNDFVPKALEVSWLDRDRFIKEAPAPEEAMETGICP